MSHATHIKNIKRICTTSEGYMIANITKNPINNIHSQNILSFARDIKCSNICDNICDNISDNICDNDQKLTKNVFSKDKLLYISYILCVFYIICNILYYSYYHINKYNIMCINMNKEITYIDYIYLCIFGIIKGIFMSFINLFLIII